MRKKQIPFESEFMPPEHEEALRWYRTLERLGPDNIRVRLGQVDCGSAGAMTGLGTEQAITKDFVEAWLKHRIDKAQRQASRW